MEMERDGGMEGWMGAGAQRRGGDGLRRRGSRSPRLGGTCGMARTPESEWRSSVPAMNLRQPDVSSALPSD